MTTHNYIASVIVPAHNEAAVIGRLLGVLSSLIASGRLDVVVACNGCTDATAEIAGKHGARVVHTDVSSKIAALNAGDRAALAFPRIYVDADVVFTEKTLLDLIAVLSRGDVMCAAPPVRVDLTGRSLPLRAYFSIWTREPYLKEGYVGSGIYGISEAGRQRFTEFPKVIADDRYIKDLYARSERNVVDTEPFTVQAPRTIASLYKRRIRISRGNLEIDLHPEFSKLAGSRDRHAPWWTSVVKNPLLIPGAVMYAVVNALAKVAARRQIRERQRLDWARDETIRA